MRKYRSRDSDAFRRFRPQNIQIVIQGDKKDSFLLGKKFLYFPLSLRHRSLRKVSCTPNSSRLDIFSLCVASYSITAHCLLSACVQSSFPCYLSELSTPQILPWISQMWAAFICPTYIEFSNKTPYRRQEGSLDLADSAAHIMSTLKTLYVTAKLKPFLSTDTSDSVRTPQILHTLTSSERISQTYD
jgi:hypothetical protein